MLGASWKTSAISILAMLTTVAGAAIDILRGGNIGTVIAMAIPVLIASFQGLFAKDSNVSNSPSPTVATTVKQPSAVATPK